LPSTEFLKRNRAVVVAVQLVQHRPDALLVGGPVKVTEDLLQLTCVYVTRAIWRGNRKVRRGPERQRRSRRSGANAALHAPVSYVSNAARRISISTSLPEMGGVGPLLLAAGGIELSQPERAVGREAGGPLPSQGPVAAKRPLRTGRAERHRLRFRWGCTAKVVVWSWCLDPHRSRSEIRSCGVACSGRALSGKYGRARNRYTMNSEH
jgi:hypothetical protein